MTLTLDVLIRTIFPTQETILHSVPHHHPVWALTPHPLLNHNRRHQLLPWIVRPRQFLFGKIVCIPPQPLLVRRRQEVFISNIFPTEETILYAVLHHDPIRALAARRRSASLDPGACHYSKSMILPSDIISCRKPKDLRPLEPNSYGCISMRTYTCACMCVRASKDCH